MLVLTLLLSVAATRAQSSVDTLLSRMTLEEKIGQMTQVTIDVVLRPGTFTIGVGGEAVDFTYQSSRPARSSGGRL